LHGRWRTGEAAADGTRPSLTFDRDGTYTGSDGCNGIGGRWVLLTGNRVLLTASGQTAMGCDNLQPVGSWVAEARTVSIGNGTLTLYDATGEPLGTFDRR
jgi:heat shock protein HslJ